MVPSKASERACQHRWNNRQAAVFERIGDGDMHRCNAPPHPPNVLQCTSTSAIHDCAGKIACTIHDCAGKIACTFTCLQRTPSHPRWQQCPQTLQWGSAESAPACGVYERALGIVNDRSAEPCVRTRCLGTNRGEGLGEGRWGGRGGQWCR